MTLDANILFVKLEEAGNDYADKDAAWNALEDTKNALLASLMLESCASSVAAKEIEAKASKRYAAHVESTRNARAEMLKAKVRYDNMKIWVDLKRTESANERALARIV